jgi:outer membrane protein
MKKILTGLLVLLVLGASAQEKNIQAFTLTEAINYALANNNNAKNSLLSEKQTKWRNHEIISVGLPTISASVDYSYYFKRPTSPALAQLFTDTTSASTRVFSYLAANDPNIANLLYQSAIASKDQEISFVLPHNLNTSLQVTQLLLDGRYFIGIKATKDFTRTAKLQTALTAQDIKLNITKAYVDAVAAKEATVLLQQNMDIITKLTDDTRKVFQQGLAEELDVNRLELAQSNLQSQILLQKQMADIALTNLKFQMGMGLDDELILKDKLEDLKNNLTLQADDKFDVTKRAEYELLQTAIKIRGYDVAQRRSGHFPSLAAFLNYGWSAQTQKFGDIFKTTTTTYPDGDTRKISPWFSQGLVGLSLNIPIFDSGAKMASTQQAKLDQQKTENDFNNFQKAADLQFRAARTTYNASLADETNSKRGLELSEKIFKKNQIKFQEGVGGSFELSQSQQEYTTNQLKYIQTVNTLLKAKAELDKAIGK